MNACARIEALIDYLWPEGDTLLGDQLYMLLDGARHPAIASLLRNGALEYACLYFGLLSARLQAAAPYLVHLAARSALTRTLLARAWGNSWGRITVGPAHLTLDQQRLHFKKLLRVRDEAGRELNFRFYDPRVLRVYLPSCTPDELRQFFGPVPRIVVETEEGAALAYSVEATGLSVDRRALTVPPPPH